MISQTTRNTYDSDDPKNSWGYDRTRIHKISLHIFPYLLSGVLKKHNFSKVGTSGEGGRLQTRSKEKETQKRICKIYSFTRRGLSDTFQMSRLPVRVSFSFEMSVSRSFRNLSVSTFFARPRSPSIVSSSELLEAHHKFCSNHRNERTKTTTYRLDCHVHERRHSRKERSRTTGTRY
jgi:hypothetical protein